MNNLPQKIKLVIHGEEIDFSLTDKREIKYYGKTATSNESLWRTDKLEDNEVFYQTKWGWGVFVNIEERVLSFNERIKHIVNSLKSNAPLLMEEDEKTTQWLNENSIPTKLITITYNNETITSYE